LIAHQKLDQCDLLYGSKLPTESGRESACCSQMSVTVHFSLIILLY